MGSGSGGAGTTSARSLALWVCGRRRRPPTRRRERREPKLITLYVLNDDGKRDRTVNPVIDGTMGDADAVFERVRYHLLRMGAHRAAHVLLAGAGAKWSWARADSLREALGPSSTQFTEVIDYFHVVERPSELAEGKRRGSDEQRTSRKRSERPECKADRAQTKFGGANTAQRSNRVAQ